MLTHILMGLRPTGQGVRDALLWMLLGVRTPMACDLPKVIALRSSVSSIPGLRSHGWSITGYGYASPEETRRLDIGLSLVSRCVRMQATLWTWALAVLDSTPDLRSRAERARALWREGDRGRQGVSVTPTSHQTHAPAQGGRELTCGACKPCKDRIIAATGGKHQSRCALKG